ncbi:MAG TPA: hypothetical protein PKD86_12205 [Gemmatales bacterium]|nr:hypothetical protein [Gemmatales bacterium]
MKKLWNDWSGPVAFTLGWTLLLAAALLMPNVPVWADPGGGIGVDTKKCKGDDGCNSIDNDGVEKKCRNVGVNCTSFDCQKSKADCKDCTCNDDVNSGTCKCRLPAT